MPFPPTLGSQSLPTLLQRISTDLRHETGRLAQEMTTGQAADPARRLRGDLGQVTVLDRRLTQIDAQERALKSAAGWAGAAQAGVGRVVSAAEGLRAAVLTVATGDPDPNALARTAASGRAALADMVGALNARLAGRPVFAGAAAAGGPLPAPQDLLAMARTAAAGSATAQEAITRVRAAFDDPAGPFRTLLYAGGAPVAPGLGTADAPLAPLPTAEDPALRATLAEAALAALLDDAATLPSQALRRDLAQRLAPQQAETAAGLAHLQAAVGEIEAGLDSRITGGMAERDALTRARDALLGVDPFEAAGRLEAARTQIEVLYAVTARVARLSLVEYLR